MRITKSQIGLAAVILFAPGGFILGATLAARAWHKRTAAPLAHPPKTDIVS